MSASAPLLEFFRRELRAEQETGFARLARVPASGTARYLAYFNALPAADRSSMIDYCAHWAHSCYGYVLGLPRLDHTQHPFFPRWQSIPLQGGLAWHSVPFLRVAVSQYKIDQQRGQPSSVPDELYALASSIRSIKAPELRRRVRAALQPLGYYRMDELGNYCCRSGEQEFRVQVDYGSRRAQLRYGVSLAESTVAQPRIPFCFEKALGFGFGDWDFIVEENVEDAFQLFAEVVESSRQLPDRIRAFVDR